MLDLTRLRDRVGVAAQRPTLADVTARLARAHRDLTAFVLPSPSRLVRTRCPSFVDVDDAVGRLATALRRAGVEPGERVAVIPSNGFDFLAAFLAVVRAGAVAVPVNPLLKPPEVRALLDRAEARTVVCDPATRASITGRARVLSLGRAPGSTDVAAVAKRLKRIDGPAEVAADDVVAVLFTSGTTGTPKGARLTSDGLLSVLSLAALHPAGAPGSFRLAVTALPVSHVMGLGVALGLMLAGITHEILPRFDAASMLDAIERDRADMFIGVPAMYRAMLEAGAEERDLRCVRVWASASDVMPADLAQRFRDMGRFAGPVRSAFAEAYGMVELSGVAMARLFLPRPLRAPKGWIPVPPYRVRITDEHGRQVRRGRAGELEIAGPGVMAGYAGERRSSAVRDGWLRTGDLARRTAAGTIELAGRRKDVIKVGGYSVFPAEVEEAIRRHPKVSDAAVIGIPDARLGHVPAAVVVARRGARLEPDALASWARDEIASYRRPRRWVVAGSIPRVGTGKADRRALEALFR